MLIMNHRGTIRKDKKNDLFPIGYQNTRKQLSSKNQDLCNVCNINKYVIIDCLIWAPKLQMKIFRKDKNRKITEFPILCKIQCCSKKGYYI